MNSNSLLSAALLNPLNGNEAFRPQVAVEFASVDHEPVRRVAKPFELEFAVLGGQRRRFAGVDADELVVDLAPAHVVRVPQQEYCIHMKCLRGAEQVSVSKPRPASCRAGEGETLMPADSMAAIFDSASPLPPAMIAPAWPMRRPGGAVRPAMKPTIGFLRPRFASSLRNWAASSSAAPPISPIMTIDSVALSARNISRMSMNSVPLTGSPPMPTAVVWPSPSRVV